MFSLCNKKKKSNPLVFAAVADGSMVQTQTLYTEATPEQLEQLQQQGIQYDVITFTDE